MAKCNHGVYIPEGETISLYCSICNPNGIPDGPVPMLPRSAGDLSNSSKTGGREYCPKCECPRTYSKPICRVCSYMWPIEETGRHQGGANARPEGACPHCGSLIHFETKKKSVWLCADCDKEYKAARRHV